VVALSCKPKVNRGGGVGWGGVELKGYGARWILQLVPHTFMGTLTLSRVLFFITVFYPFRLSLLFSSSSLHSSSFPVSYFTIISLFHFIPRAYIIYIILVLSYRYSFAPSSLTASSSSLSCHLSSYDSLLIHRYPHLQWQTTSLIQTLVFLMETFLHRQEKQIWLRYTEPQVARTLYRNINWIIILGCAPL
jgi:hypothetical protein